MRTLSSGKLERDCSDEHRRLAGSMVPDDRWVGSGGPLGMLNMAFGQGGPVMAFGHLG